VSNMNQRLEIASRVMPVLLDIAASRKERPDFIFRDALFYADNLIKEEAETRQAEAHPMTAYKELQRLDLGYGEDDKEGGAK
jgi:hypothetical protein